MVDLQRVMASVKELALLNLVSLSLIPNQGIFLRKLAPVTRKEEKNLDEEAKQDIYEKNRNGTVVWLIEFKKIKAISKTGGRDFGMGCPICLAKRPNFLHISAPHCILMSEKSRSSIDGTN